MKNTFIKKILSSVAAVSVAVTAIGTTAAPVWAFDAPQPDTGAAGGISNGGEWSIYASRFAKIRGAFEEQTDSAGILEVTGSEDIGAAFQFDLSTKDDNPAAENKVIKSATLRLTPMVSKSGLNQNLYTINNEFNKTEDKEFVAGFSIPRGSRDDFFSAAEITALSADSLSAYPEDLARRYSRRQLCRRVRAGRPRLTFPHPGRHRAPGRRGRPPAGRPCCRPDRRQPGRPVRALYPTGMLPGQRRLLYLLPAGGGSLYGPETDRK